MAGSGEKPGKIFYSMGEVSEMFDVNPSLIRFWEQKFDILKPKKNKKGNRLFSPEDVRNLKVIYHLVKERGMTLAGAQKYMKASRHTIERDMELAERLQSIRALLTEVRDALGGDGIIDENVFNEPPALPEQVEISVEIKEEICVEEAVVPQETIQEPAFDEDVEALMQEAIAEMSEVDEPEDIPDFELEPETETETEMGSEEDENPEDGSKPEEPRKPFFIEQTLF